MKYNIDSIDLKNGFLFFWGHQPSEDGTILKSCFSQWWLSSFEVNNIIFNTAEHWMMAKKAELFGDSDVFNQIISTESPAEVKKLGRLVKNYNDETWLKSRYNIVKEGNLHKFSQNEELKKFLLSTKDTIIVEASPVDPIWGIGMAEEHKDAKNIRNWRGLNLLGFALMEVRDVLK